MKAVIQRVTEAELKVDGELISKIGKGYVIFLGVGKGDTEEQADYLIKKIPPLRIFEDENGKINLNKFSPITYDPVHHTYRKLGDVVGKAFSVGTKLYV